MPRYEIVLDDAQRHALATACNMYLLAFPGADPLVRDRLDELAGMLAGAVPDAINDFTA